MQSNGGSLKGFDPRDITLVAFGGAGPLHAAALAGAAGIPAVLVPQRPGVFSAVGLVMADIRHDFVRTRVMRGAGITADRLAPTSRSAALAGATGRLVVNPDDPNRTELASNTVDFKLRRGDVISMSTQGGGAYPDFANSAHWQMITY